VCEREKERVNVWVFHLAVYNTSFIHSGSLRRYDRARYDPHWLRIGSPCGPRRDFHGFTNDVPTFQCGWVGVRVCLLMYVCARVCVRFVCVLCAFCVCVCACVPYP